MPRPTSPTRPTAPDPRPLPIQNVQFTEDDFKDPRRISAKFNVTFQQVLHALTSLQGAGGRTVLPSGVDVAGETVTGLGSPKSASDAVSLGHAEGNYSAPVVGPQLDLGGKNAMPGLTSLALLIAQGANGTITLGKITGGGANGSITVANGLITEFTNPT